MYPTDVATPDLHNTHTHATTGCSNHKTPVCCDNSPERSAAVRSSTVQLRLPPSRRSVRSLESKLVDLRNDVLPPARELPLGIVD